VRDVGGRIEQLLDEIRAMSSPPAFERVEDIIRTIVEFYGAGLERIVEIAAASAAGHELRGRFTGDPLVASLLLLHRLHPDDLPTRVRNALEKVRPYLGSHGGDVELVEADAEAGLVRLKMKGSCDGCPSSLLTVKLALEGAIQEMAPEVSRIVVEGITAAAPIAEPVRPWVALDAPRLSPGQLATAAVVDAQIVLCRVGNQLYAYQDRCPSCGEAMHDGGLAGEVLRCAACGERYDVRLAGRSLARAALHLDPVPLLEDASGIRVAVAGAPS
jgi:Fe-S cluster biogenesis protein NfuA/nitrite reductase/ring-hydroxylating ferredoxin subunit